MNETETLQRAKMYIDKLANGINPLDDTPVGENDVINNVRLSRCFFYISDVLRQVIENNGTVSRTNKVSKKPFALSQEEKEKFDFSDMPIAITEITKRLNDLVDLEVYTKLNYTALTSWLVEEDILKVVPVKDGKTAKRPTEKGNKLGIITDERIGLYGNYVTVVYTREAQQFILDNLEAILEALNTKAK